ncbi:MAG: glycoside hydrolase family 5 protein, partial [Pseudonocardiaceae bacterium]
EQATPVPDEYLAANPDLSGATPMQVYDACVEALTGAGLVVIPNCHTLDPGWCCSGDDGNGLWYSDRWPAAKFFTAWQGMAARYKSNPLVAAMDVMNEPRRTRMGWRVVAPTWGTRPRTDIATMYTTAGNLIHEVSPELLIICEGLDYAADLACVARHPVRLERQGKVVYSLHDYSWFHPGEQPRAAYLEQMERAGGYLLSQQVAPLWIGEFGTDTRSLAGISGVWWNNFEAWVTAHDVDWCWWALNPTQPKGTVPVTGRHRSDWGDPEPWGLLAPDWRGVANPQILDILKAMIPPRTGPGVS